MKKEDYNSMNNFDKNKIIFLAKEYQLVVGDEFQLFYQGVIRSLNPNKYNILIECDKGNPFPRYYSFNPKDDDEGKYNLKLSIFEDNNNIIETAETTLVVTKAQRPKRKQNILCIGDSLTFNGVWCSEGYRRFSKINGTPMGLGFDNSLNMIGTCTKEVENDIIGYEGYGSWQWKHFCTDEIVSTTSCVWINTKHDLDENDQHSIWVSGKLKWIVESIEKNRIKFKRGEGNYSITPSIDSKFIHLIGGIHKEDINVLSYEFEKGNPFYDKGKQDIDFESYIKKNNFEGIDYVYILLTWNGQYIPFNDKLTIHEQYIRKLLDSIHFSFPLCKIRLLGIQSPSITGGIASNYGAHGPYSNIFGTLSSAYYYNTLLEELTNLDEYKKYVKYVDTKAQFDTINNMPYIMKPVNTRSKNLEMIGTNGVHPNMDGYLQIGDVFYRILVQDMKNEA